MSLIAQDISLIRKYNVPGPRYTSYPTVPYWKDSPSEKEWLSIVKNRYDNVKQDSGISLYIHLPFCESLCTYCGCNTRITVNHKVEEPYIDALLKEWEIYLNNFGEQPLITELHLGGGTPTFFTPENLAKLILGLKSKAKFTNETEMSFEAHPNNTTDEHLETLYQLGFRRLSLGIQDFDLKVQDTINRIQPLENVIHVTNKAREIGYTSINYDLVYGLPFQNKETVTDTIKKVIDLKPDRIAFYSYAHVPWVKPGQRKFTELDLPKDEIKRELYETGKSMFSEAGYFEIGMDHFALETDDLYKSFEEKKLHRNFMGYTTRFSGLMIGLGVSSISDAWFAFAQNAKVVEEYISAINQGKLAVFRGHKLNDEDLIIRKHILNLMCRFETNWLSCSDKTDFISEAITHLKVFENDGLAKINEHGIKLTDKGKPFSRNICMALDARLYRDKPGTQIFSSTI